MRRCPLLVLLICFIARPVVAQVSSSSPPKRPQTPQAPFAYEAIDVTIPVLDERSGEQTHTLGGTLTLPDAEQFGEGPFIGVVLLSGSGMQDRDSMIFDHKPFLVIADYLTSRGIAVLRYDDRLVGESTGNPADGVTTEALAHDGLSAAKFMMAQDKIDPDRVGLLGHSEGGMHVPYLAVENDSIAFVISLAGVGITGMDLMLDQTERLFRAGGFEEDFIEGSVARRRAIMNSVIDGDTDDQIINRIIVLNVFEMGVKRANLELRKRSAQLLPQFASDWTRSFLVFDSRVYWKRVTVPSLVLNGSMDLQVSPEPNLGAIRAALEEGGQNKHTVAELEGLNHLFQHAETGMIGEYAQLTETFAPEALAMIEEWIQANIVQQPDAEHAEDETAQDENETEPESED